MANTAYHWGQMRRVLIVLAALFTVATTARAQCPDGAPPPCALVRRAATVAHAPPSAALRARRFLLLPFRNVTRGAPQEWLVTGAPLMLGEALAQYRDLTVVPEEKLTAARRRLGIPSDVPPDAAQMRRLADDTDGWTAITGNVFATGARLRISVQALDVPTARVLVRAETDVAADADVRDAFNRLSVKLLEAAGVPAASVNAVASTTTSVDAYRAYVQGIDLLHRSSYHRAQLAFAEAVKFDSMFALAWGQLAITSVAADMRALFDPTGPAFRASAQASRLAPNLPKRLAAHVRIVQYTMRSDIPNARRLADSLVATDRDDLDALEFLSAIELFDMGLTGTGAATRPRFSLQRSVERARDVLDRDPGRRFNYRSFAFVYGVGAGFWLGAVPAFRGDDASIISMMMRLPDTTFVPVVRDTIALVGGAEFDRWPEAERQAARRRSADVGMQWVERWLAAGPDDAEAHLWASRLAELQGDRPRALLEVIRAESLGAENSIENVRGRHVALLVSMGQYERAGALADSMLAAGALKQAPLDRLLDRGRQYSAAALLLSRRWGSAVALAELVGPRRDGRPLCHNLERQLSPVTRASALPAEVLRAVMDTVTAHIGEVGAVAKLAPCAEQLASKLAPSDA